MGSSNSQPQPRPTPKRTKSQGISEQQQLQGENLEDLPPLLYQHEKYEELTFNFFGILNRPTRTISASDLFYIAVCYPYYCQSVHEMIRQAIRTQSIQEAREDPDYTKNFQFSENMDYSRVKVLERCQYRHKFRAIFQNANSPPIQFIEKDNEGQIIQKEEINFNRIITMLRNSWSQQNRSIITKLLKDFNELTNMPTENFRKVDTIMPILSQLMGNDNCHAFVPHRDLNWEEIDEEFNELKALLTNSKPRCCMNFSPSEPLHSINVEGTILPHGICSNGKFLFTLTKEKELSVFLIYKGMINRRISKFQLGDKWEINNKTVIFCSQKWLFMKAKNITYHVPISDIACDDNFSFKVANRLELHKVVAACSNGATYSIVNSQGSLLIFDADSEKIIVNNENHKLSRLLNLLDDEIPIVTNGMFIGLLLDEKVLMLTTYLKNDYDTYVNEDCFPKDYNREVKAATIDILSGVYFSVIHDGTNSKICSHPYVGSPDSYLFGLKFTDSLNNDSFESCLLKYLIPCAFSPSIPDNLIANSNPVDIDLKSIVKWIQKYVDNQHLIKALILIIDLNLSKYESKDVAHLLLPTLKDLLVNKDYKRLVSALLINHFDLFFEELGLIEFGLLFTILLHLPNNNGDIFNEWALNKISHSSLLSKVVMNEVYAMSLFTDRWHSISRDENPYSWYVDILLIAQQNSFEEAVEIVEKDPLNLNESELISSLCSYAQFLMSQFVIVIEKIIEDNPRKSDRKLDYDSVLYTLISNFFASAAPITGCVQFANVITNDDARKIIRLLNDDFEFDDTLQLFIGYFDMIYTTSISSLIRGGSTYPCEDEYKWLIHGNFNNGTRNLTPPDLSQARFFLSSLDNEVITNGSEHLEYLYKNCANFKLRNEDTSIDAFLMAAVTHQTNTFHLLLVRNDDDDNSNNNNNDNDNDNKKKKKKIPEELSSICIWVRNMRRRFISARRLDNSNIDNENPNYQKQSDRFLANLGILILLDPTLTDYLEKPPSERAKYLLLLEKFIQNNEPYQFHKILKAIPTRIENVLNGFDQLNSLFQTIQNQTFHRIIIDGISRVDSFERLGYLLSHAELDEHALNTLTIFNLSCISLLQDFHQISILEILYTVLQACKNFNDKAIECMNELSVYIRHNKILSDPFFYTVAGLSCSTSAIPEILSALPPIAKACIIQLIFSKKDAPLLTAAELFSYSILDKESLSSFDDPVWIKMLFTVFVKCEDDERGTLNQLIIAIFESVANRLDQRHLVFSTLPEIIYGFRAILNSENNLSIALQTLLQTITIDSTVGEKMLLFAITAGDISDFSKFYAIRNRHGKWLKFSNDANKDSEYCLQIPITPLSERRSFDINEITDPVQDVELDLQKGLSFDTILVYWDTCMRDQGSLLCRLYLETLTKYVVAMNNKIPEEYLSSFAKSAKPYIDFHILLSNQTKLYKNISSSFNLVQNLLPENEYGFGVINQSELTHLFAYNVMKLGDVTISAIMLGDGFIVIHKQEPIVIQIPSGVFNTSDEPITIENGIIQITIESEQSIITINDAAFVCEPNTYIEFIVNSIDQILFDMNQYNFTDSQTVFDDVDNLNVEYTNNIFDNDGRMDAFVDDIKSIKPLKFNEVNAEQIERAGKNIPYNKMIDDNCFKENLPFDGSASMHLILSRKNEFNICNQLKSVILAQEANNDIQSLDWPTSFSLIKSAVVTVVGLNRDRLKDGLFPYDLEKGFFLSCSLNFIQSSNVQIFFNAIKSLIKSETFMNELGKNLVIMAQDRVYHSLIHKSDLVFVMPEDIEKFSPNPEKDFIIDFADKSKGKIEIDDSGSWLIDTPIVLLLLLWIFIDNCTTSVQRVCAKLAIVDCMLIRSPMINKYMPEFLTYIQDKMAFQPEDFNPVYIHHLSTLALKNPNNPQILAFYRSERNCFRFRQVQQSLISQSLDFDQIPTVSFDASNHELSSSNLNEIIQLLKSYKSVNEFPVWYFLPIWKTISSTTYEKYVKKVDDNDDKDDDDDDDDDEEEACVIREKDASAFNPLDVPLLYTITIICLQKKQHENDDDDNYNCQLKVHESGSSSEEDETVKLEKFDNVHFGTYLINPKERKRFVWKCAKKVVVKIEMYKVVHNNHLTHDTLMRDIKSFSVDWQESATEELLMEYVNFKYNHSNFIHVLLSTLSMTELIQKYGIHAVQCKILCLFMFNLYSSKFSIKSLSQDDDEIRRIGRKYSKYFVYQNRINQFTIEASVLDRRLAMMQMMLLSEIIMPITLNSESALNFIKGKSSNVCDSMIYQLSEAISKYSPERFRLIIWKIDFKGSEALDLTGVTNETITMAVNSFLFLKTGLCIISPNFTENTPNSITANPNEMGDTLVIPYPSNNNVDVDDESINLMLFGFGVVLGSMIRCGVVQDIPFPDFIWNFLAGDSITKEDVYQNDARLRDQIVKMKEGSLNDHHWNYRDWNNVVKPILGFPEDKIVSKENVEIYETIVVDLRIKSLVKVLTHIRNGLYLNQEIEDDAFLSGGLISFLCQGKKKIDVHEIIKRLMFENGNEQLRNNFISILSDFDQVKIKRFLLFTTAKQRPPNFSIVPDYFITVKFDDNLKVTGYPVAHTCFNEIDVPTYPTLDIMKEKLDQAIQYCEGMDIK